MGSTGSGSFGDYVPSGKDQCTEAVEVELDDVARNAYWSAQKAVPKKGTLVNLRATPTKGRLVVEEAATGTAVGFLPTTLNYLLMCIAKGHSYKGEVLASGTKPTPFVKVKLEPA